MALHFVMTLEEHRAAIGGRYVDPARYGARMGSDPTTGRPEMICRTGDGHAEGTRDWSRVTCPQCLVRKPGADWSEEAADIVRAMDDQQVSRAAEDIDTAAMIARGLTGQTITATLAEAVRDTCRGLTMKGA